MKRKYVIPGKDKLGRKMKKALWRWVYFVDRYCRERWTIDEDNPYWHNERGSVGLLAASIWSTGGLALEEHPAEVIRGRKAKDVRLDLWCCLNGVDYAFEAKQRDIRLSPRTTPAQVTERLQAALGMAAGDVRKRPGYGRRAGILFALPYAYGAHHREPEEMGRLLRVFVKGVTDCDSSFVAWCFQPKGRCTWSYWPRKGRTDYYFWPGVAVIGRALKRL